MGAEGVAGAAEGVAAGEVQAERGLVQVPARAPAPVQQVLAQPEPLEQVLVGLRAAPV